MTPILEIYPNTLTCVVYNNDGIIRLVQSFPNWQSLLATVFTSIPNFVSVRVRS